MTIQPHDFSRPPSLHPETRTKLVEWITRSNSLLVETSAALAVPIEVQLDDCVTALPVVSLQEWSEKSVAFRVRLADLAPVSVMALPNPLAQVLIGTLLGEHAEEWPSERDLTPAELSVGEFFVSTIINSLVEGWVDDTKLDLRVVGQESNLRRTKVFKFKDPFIVCRTTIRTSLGSGQFCWMLPHEFLTKIFGSVRGPDSTSTSGVNSRQQLEMLARDMTTQVTVRLGTVQLSAPQLSELRVGDLVVLNQKTTEPLRAMVAGKPRFLGWPGRVGTRQAFEIASDGSRKERQAENANGVAAASR